MNVELMNPYGLIFIPLVVLFLWWSIKKQKGTVLKRGVIITRIVLCSLLIGALCGISIRIVGKNAATVFLLDASDSMRESREESVSFIQEALKELPRKHKAGVVVFGSNSQMDKFLDESKLYSKVGVELSTSATNIEQAIQTALAYLTEEANKEIILISDGQENEGNMLEAVEMVNRTGVDFKIHKISHQSRNEVYIDSLSIPEKIYKDESFLVTTKIISNVKTKAKLSLYAGTEKKSEEWIDIEVGENAFVFKDVQSSGGFKQYKAVLSCNEDSEIGNNEYTAFTTIEDVPKVLVIEGTKGEAIGIQSVLEQMGGNYESCLAESAPSTLENMLAYQAIVMSDVYLQDLPEGFLEQIENYVKNYGGGLLVTGGENAYALGGYENTVLEDILPVEMHKKGKKAMPAISLSLVIDHSGSMCDKENGMSKLNMSIQAAAAVVDYLDEDDEISVFSFDDSYTEVVPRQKVKDKEAIKSLIFGINEGGGTSIYPALEAAYNVQSKSEAGIKHIILLTDGQDGYGMLQYDELVSQIQSEKITLSTVAVGDGANNNLLRYLAENGGGRSYIADRASNLPRIFAKEFFMSTGEYLINETFQPKVTSSHEVLKGVMDDGEITLDGYVGTSMKPLGTQVLTSLHDEPILALWQCGLGKTVAWTSDADGGWTSALLSSNKGLQLFKNILNWSIMSSEGNGEVQISESGEGAKITFKASDIETARKVSVSYESMEGNKEEQELTEIAPGIYESEIPLEEKGFYAFNVNETLQDGTSANYIAAFAKQYSREYKFNDNNGKLEQFVEAVGGKFIHLPNEAFKLESKISYKTIELTNILLIVAGILFLMDIIARRFDIQLEQLVKLDIIEKHALTFRDKTNRASMKKNSENQKVEVKQKLTTLEFNESKKKSEQNKAVARKKKEKTVDKKQAAEGTLDTAALLKKKNDRNR